MSKPLPSFDRLPIYRNPQVREFVAQTNLLFPSSITAFCKDRVWGSFVAQLISACKKHAPFSFARSLTCRYPHDSTLPACAVYAGFWPNSHLIPSPRLSYGDNRRKTTTVSASDANIRIPRERRASLRRFAKMIGIDYAHLSNIETGKANPTSTSSQRSLRASIKTSATSSSMRKSDCPFFSFKNPHANQR